MDETKWSWIYGFSLLGVITTLAVVIALGTVTADKSFGLPGVLEALKMLTGVWAGWKFGRQNQKGDSND
jgi:hypothetical protein